jgi:E3 ubiquitin-protein ligase RNF14
MCYPTASPTLTKLLEMRLECVSSHPRLSCYLDSWCNRAAAKVEFNKMSYECVVCQSRKKGSTCYQFERCGHIYCVACLQAGYHNAILSGNIDGVHCLSCLQGAKKQLITPAELLRIPIPRPAVQRYVDMKRKKQLESDQSTIWCPRPWCQGAARNSAYPLPTLPLQEMGDYFNDPPKTLVPVPEYDENDDEDTMHKKALTNAVRVCEVCALAFCIFCRKTWHSPAYDCRSRLFDPSEHAKLSAEDEASETYIRMHTKPCPKCV